MRKGKFNLGKFLGRLLGNRLLTSGIFLASSLVSAVNTGLKFHRNLKSKERVNERAIYSLDETASLLSLHPAEVASLVESGELCGRRFGSTYRILGRCILQFFNERG